MAKDIYLFYESNEYYAPMTGISIMSVLNEHKMTGIIHFVVVSDGISDESIEKIQKNVCKPHDIRIIDATKYLGVFNEIDSIPAYFGSYTNNLHFFVGRFFPDDVEKCIFLDGDTLMVDDIEKAWDEIDLRDKVIGMSIDCISQRYKKNIGLNKHLLYYNTNFIVYDLKKWREKDIENKLFNFVRKSKKVYDLADQDIYNIVLYDDIQKMPIKYNLVSAWLMYDYRFYKSIYGITEEMLTKEEYDNSIKHPVCYHFAGNTFGRPWYKKCIHPAIKDYLAYFNNSEWKDNCRWFTKKTPFIYEIWNIMYLHFPKWVFGIIATVAQNIFMFYSYDMKRVWKIQR